MRGLTPGSAPLVEVQDVWKSFGEVTALRGASMWANRGELTAIVGDNGAGKSTLIKCISGIHVPDQGSIQIAGTAVTYRGPEQARHHGIETVYQDLALVDDLAVYQNVFLHREPTWGFGPVRFLARRTMEERTRTLFAELNVSVPSVSGKVRGLSGGQRQAVAIARGVMWGRELVIMDEPTAALGIRETAKVEILIRELVTRGIGIIIISHNLEQVMRLSTRIWVMRRGQVVGGIRTDQARKEDVVAMITGLQEDIGRRTPPMRPDQASEPPEATNQSV
ncbi:MAG TPA: ATP-binding cassette domain-containing protein [Silvibacterium sp.]|nr:ATP-binding cassette domain-containing protein [Silvibacterium sp.]